MDNAEGERGIDGLEIWDFRPIQPCKAKLTWVEINAMDETGLQLATCKAIYEYRMCFSDFNLEPLPSNKKPNCSYYSLPLFSLLIPLFAFARTFRSFPSPRRLKKEFVVVHIEWKCGSRPRCDRDTNTGLGSLFEQVVRKTKSTLVARFVAGGNATPYLGVSFHVNWLLSWICRFSLLKIFARNFGVPCYRLSIG